MFGLNATELLLCPGITTSNLDQNFNWIYQGYRFGYKKEKILKSEGLKPWRLYGYPSFGKTSTGNPYITSSENYLLGKATRGGPQASEGLMDIPVLARPPLGTLMPELFLLVLPLKARNPLGALNLVLLACLPTTCLLPPRGHCILPACCSTIANSAMNDKRYGTIGDP